MTERASWAVVGAIVIALTVAARANGRPPMTNGVVFRPGDQAAVYVATTFGLLVSPDACRFYWLCENDIGYGGEFDPGYAVTPTGALLATTFRGLRVSRDGGCSFTTATAMLPLGDPSNLSEVYLDALEVGPSGDVWVGTAEAGTANAVFRSVDDAVSFTATGALPGTMWFRSIRIAPSMPARVYITAFQAAGSGPPPSAHWFASDDTGATWRELPATGVVYGSSPELRVAAVDRANPDIAFVVSPVAHPPAGDRLYRSGDAGATLTEVLVTTDAITGVVIRDATTVIVATRLGGSFESTDGGRTFALLPGAPQLACLGQRGDGVLFGCAANGDPDHMALARSVDARSWERVMGIEYISAPLDCPVGTVQYDSCEDKQWRGLTTQLGIVGAACAAGPDAGVAPVADTSAPVQHGGCCEAGRDDGRGTLALALFVGLASISVRRPARAARSSR